MEWTEKSPSTWNWENHNSLSGSELRNSSSKLLISVSTVSSSKSPIETKDLQLDEQNKSKSNDLTTAELGLKLGKRTYFEDACVGNNSMTKNSNTSTTKKIRASQVSSGANYRCQVEGCNVDLSGAKDYHKKHRVCDVHSKCSKVVVAGQECRFCQQCSRFHGLLEFDHKKRSCRRRLSDHNARRRKPQVETISFNSSTYCSPFYEDRQQVGFVLNKAPFSIMRQNVGSTWNDSSGFSLTHSKGSWINKPVKVERTDEHTQLSNTAISNFIPSLAFDTDKLVNFKGPTHETLGEGTEAASVSASNFDRSALSLLSTESWVSSNLAQSNLPPLISTNHHHNNNNSDLEDGFWKYQVTQAQETPCATPFEHHNSNSNGGAQFDAPFFDSNQILSKPNFLF